MTKDNNTPADMAEAMSQAAGNSAADLIRQHFPEIEAAMGDSGKLTVSLSFKYTRTKSGYKQRVKISYAQKHSDEREVEVDPAQVKIDGIE